MKIRIKNTDDYAVLPDEYMKILNEYNYTRVEDAKKVKHYIEINTIEELIDLYKKLDTNIPDTMRGALICSNWEDKEICIEIYDDYRE